MTADKENILFLWRQSDRRKSRKRYWAQHTAKELNVDEETSRFFYNLQDESIFIQDFVRLVNK
jgi:hypothetical protein